MLDIVHFFCPLPELKPYLFYYLSTILIISALMFAISTVFHPENLEIWGAWVSLHFETTLHHLNTWPDRFIQVAVSLPLRVIL